MKKNNDTDAPYGLYIDYDCVEEFNSLTDAEKGFNNAVKENPDSIIDILSNDGEQSFFGYNN